MRENPICEICYNKGLRNVQKPGRTWHEDMGVSHAMFEQLKSFDLSIGAIKALKEMKK